MNSLDNNYGDTTDSRGFVAESLYAISDAHRAQIGSFLALLDHRDGTFPLSDQAMVDFNNFPRAKLAALLFYATSTPNDLLAYAQVTSPGDESSIEFAIHPALRHNDDLFSLIVRSASNEALAQSARSVTLWMTEPYHHLSKTITSLGFHLDRSVVQLKIALPLAPHFKDEIKGFTTRTFKPGIDEAAWLALNARAFRDHPEQGAWSAEDIAARETLPWFDPNSFLIAESHGQLAGACWIKIHYDVSPEIGEIYVISVDPSYQGLGLGKALTISGLRWLETHQIDQAMLYVDAHNERALSLYRSIGFREFASRSVYRLAG